MFQDNNLWIVFLSLLPALIYSIIVFFHTPYKSVNIKMATIYMFGGVLSTFIIGLLEFMFPNWYSPLATDTYVALFLAMFLQVALKEEMSKFLLFKTINYSTESKDAKTPLIAIMFYTMMIGAGFSIAENFEYINRYGEMAAVVRSFSSVVVHMVCGLFMGYFIALGRTPSKGNSEFSEFFKKHSLYKKGAYTALGIIAAAFLHGAYDFNLSSENPFADLYMWVLLLGSLLVARKMFNEIKEIE